MPEPMQIAELAKLFNISIMQLCSLPKIRKTREPPSSYAVIIDLLKKYIEMRLSPKGRKNIDKPLKEIIAYLEKEFDELLF